MVFYPPTSYHCGEICSLPYNGYNTSLSLYIYITPRTRTMVLYNIWLYIYHISIYLSLYIYTYIYISYIHWSSLEFLALHFQTESPSCGANGGSDLPKSRWQVTDQWRAEREEVSELRSSPREDTISMTSKHENAYMYMYVCIYIYTYDYIYSILYHIYIWYICVYIYTKIE